MTTTKTFWEDLPRAVAEVEKAFPVERLRQTVVKRPDGTHVLVSTIERPEWRLMRQGYRFETMAFPCDEDGALFDGQELDAIYADHRRTALWSHERQVRGYGEPEKELEV